MSRHYYQSQQQPVPDNVSSRSGGERHRLPGMLRAVLGRAVNTITAFATRFTRYTMTLAPLPLANGVLIKYGAAGKRAAGQWVWPKAPLVLPRSKPTMLTCHVGTVWITQGDTNDYVLSAGEQITLAPRDYVIVTAMSGPALIEHTSLQESPFLALTTEPAMNGSEVVHE